MRKIYISIISFIAFALSANAEVSQPPFKYPEIPDSLTTLQDRTTYIMTRFWDNADMKSLMADTAKFNRAFADYASFIPYANVDSVKSSINALTARFKDDPKNLLKLAKAAEKEMFGPDAEFWADEQYMLFTRPVFVNKKISSKDKQYFLDQVKMLNSSQLDATVATIDYTTRHGAKHVLQEQKSDYFLLYFRNGDCQDCNMTQLRMETDVAINNLQKAGKFKIIDIYVGTPDDSWKSSVESLPYEWEAGYSTTVQNLIDVRELPRMYLLDKNYKIIARNLGVNQVLSIASELYKQQ